MEGQTITFTFSDGSTQPITIPAGEKGQTVVVKDGELYIDDEATGIKVAEELDTEAGLVKSENGTWWVLNENGEYTNTNIPVSGITVSGSEKDGYTFTIYDEKGESQTLKLPSAVSSITEMTLGGELHQFTTADITDKEGKFLISNTQFVQFNPTQSVKDDGITDASKWPGNKKMPNAGDYIYASPTSVDLRIDPVNVDASTIDFYLTNTKNADLSPVVLNASASQDSDKKPMTNTNGRAAVTGNGLWTLSMENVKVEKNAHADTWKAIVEARDAANGEGYVYAVNANHGFRSKYELTISTVDAEKLQQLSIEGVENTLTCGVDVSKYNDKNVTFKTGTAYTVNAIQKSALYDMYLTADKSDIEVYGLTFDQDKHTFTIGKNPDVSTVDANFTLIVYTVANNGTVNKATVTININTEISNAAEYTLQEHSINKDANKNYFGIDLSTMKTALGDNLNQWMQNVDLSDVDYELLDANKNSISKDGFKFAVVEKLIDIPTGGVPSITDRNKANFIEVSVDNNGTNYMKLGSTYYIKATFKTATDGILNSIVVPVKFNAPALSAQFVKESAVFKDGGNTAYAYMNYEDQTSGESAYKLSRAFSAMPDAGEGVTLSLDNVTKVVENTNYTSKSVAKFSETECTKTVKVELSDPADYTRDKNTNLSAGYGKELIVNAIAKELTNLGYQYKNTRWLYASAEDATYTFKIKVMSPIYEGTVTATDNIVTIPATGSAYNLSNNDIKGTTYNNITYKVLPDAVLKVNGKYVPDWSRKEVTNVIAKSNNVRVFTVGDENNSGSVNAATDKTQNGEVVGINEGYFKVIPQNIAETTESTMTVTVEDVWGYKKPNDIKVKITVGE